MRDAALEMIRLAKDRGAKVVVCSSDSADEPRAYLDAGADFILVGEGEDTFADLLRMLNNDAEQNPRSIPGLAFISASGELVRTARRPVIRRVDDLPLPAWDLIDLDRYREIWTRRHGRFALNLVTTRGCPYHCNWCAKPIWGQRYNARSPEHVVEELIWLKSLADFDHIWFMDDIFGLKPRWISRFADRLSEANIEIRFKCLSRPDLLLRTGETAALARAGCDIVWMGAESGSQRILDAMDKGTTVEMIVDACSALRAAGIRVGLFIQFGYPGEWHEDIRATIQLIREIMPDELGISVSYPLPGTRFHERVRSELGKTRQWQDSDDLAMLFKGPFSTRYYRALHRYVHSDVAIRRAWKDGRFLLLAYSVIRRGWFAGLMAVWSRLPHQGMKSLAPGMPPVAAATPSDQPVD
jgi:anaerobic magnesium-protoporphyrin IX monomethyl ester cyclase